MSVRWFVSNFAARCEGCGRVMAVGTSVAYTSADDEDSLIGFYCCGIEAVSENDPSEKYLKTANYLPPGRTKQDLCARCFIIHTTAQGSECM